MPTIYFDHNATTAVDEKVLEAMMLFFFDRSMGMHLVCTVMVLKHDVQSIKRVSKLPMQWEPNPRKLFLPAVVLKLITSLFEAPQII